MSISIPSKRITIADIPEVKSFRASFVYNFFAQNESVDESGNVASKFKTIPAESFDAARIDEARRVVPRFVRFDFTNVTLHPGGLLSGNEFIQQPNPTPRTRGILIKDHLNEIQNESEFSSHEFIGFDFQDNNVDKKLYTIVSGTLAKRVASKNRSILDQINEKKDSILENLSTEYSLLDAAKALASDTGENVDNNVIVNSLNQIDALNLKLVDNETQKLLIDNSFEKIKNVSMRGQISSKIVGRVIKNIVNDPMSIFSDEFAASSRRALTIQNRARARTNPNLIQQSEFEPVFNAIEQLDIQSPLFPSSSEIIGYIIEKQEMTSDGKLKSFPPIVIENPNVNTTVDLNVAYGKTYVYTIRTVAILRIKATIDETEGVALGVGLISSRKSSKVIVECIEKLPPPCPVDFNVNWDYKNNAPCITWNFPVNKQRDIKRFQIFRRSSINEPFQLIKEYNFDDSIIKYENFETPDISLVEKLNYPKTIFLDLDFKRTSNFIYTLCSIDAHGFSSNYSTQLKVSFDILKNKVRKELISFAGAPKSYPNMYLNYDTFVDTINVSGFTKLNVFFDPEYLNVFDQNNSDLRLITKSNIDNGKYKLTFINTDIMEQEDVDIFINDMRPTNKR